MVKKPLSKEQAEAVTRRSVLADGSLCLRTSKFTQVITQLGPGVMLVTGIGYNSGECAPLVTAELSRAIPSAGKLSAFVNLSEQTGQASIAREWWADWSKQNRAQLTTTHMFVRSKMMDMAISVLVMLIGSEMVRTHSNRTTFEAAIAERVRGFRALPTYPDLPPLLE
ncbi:MAG TPA: hypothetical protein VER96_14350 [Polyangiaceae bacterium]|nr:hypothetical protein [Polyangiaceae bacterium]